MEIKETVIKEESTKAIKSSQVNLIIFKKRQMKFMKKWGGGN